MTTNLAIQNAFADLFATRTPQQVQDDAAQLLSFRYLSEIAGVMEAQGLTRRALAARVGTSASYITQLFRGDRLLNLQMVAKLEHALGVQFRLRAVPSSAPQPPLCLTVPAATTRPPQRGAISGLRKVDLHAFAASQATSGGQFKQPLTAPERVALPMLG